MHHLLHDVLPDQDIQGNMHNIAIRIFHKVQVQQYLMYLGVVLGVNAIPELFSNKIFC